MKIHELIIDGCQELISEMRGIQEKITELAGTKAESESKLDALRKEYAAAIEAKEAADKANNMAAWQKAFERADSLRQQIESAEANLNSTRIQEAKKNLLSQYEELRRQVYKAEAEAQEAVEAAERAVKERSVLRGHLATLFEQIKSL